jgi:hypothetical protein
VGISVAIWPGVRPVGAEVLDVAAAVDATAVQFTNGDPVLVDRETLAVEAGQTGTATAAVDDLGDLGRTPIASASSAVFFKDPFTPGPVGYPIGEFGGELMAVTLDPHINQQVTGDTFETRTIRVTASEAGLPLESGVVVTGEMYLNGAILVWSNRADENLDTLEARVGFEIELDRAGLDPRFVLSSVVEVSGLPGNHISTSTGGVITDPELVVMDLSSDFPELGAVHLVMFPQLLLPYSYEVRVGEEYTLVARLRLIASTVPGSVGVAVTAGGPFDRIADELNLMYGGDMGTRLQDRVAAEMALFPVPDEPRIPFQAFEQTFEQTTGQTCAPMGVEAIGLLSLMSLMTFTVRGRRVVRGRR